MSLLNFWKSDKTFSQPVNWGITAFMVALHIAALAAVFFFTWKAFLLAVVMWWVAGSLGIGMGYHRLLTHRGYKTPKGVEYFLTTCGSLAFEGGPISWVATHRIHHQNTDKEGDPHSPRDGGFWAHMGWILTGRTVLSLHFTWLVNSATHIWGTQRFATGDSSTNSFWVAFLTFGEGWHNNHHAQPQSARHGFTWYELDVNWYGIWTLRTLGLAWDVKMPKMNAASTSRRLAA